jgi:hypothetical protein
MFDFDPGNKCQHQNFHCTQMIWLHVTSRFWN